MRPVDTLNKIAKLLLATSLLTIPALAQAGGTDGGTETTADLVAIPRLSLDDFSQIPGSDLFAQKMRVLKKILPDLEARLETAINGKSWYHVPADFDTLTNEQQKFHFTIKTPAYQNDRQVFLSDYALAKMAPEDGANMLLQEAFEAMQNPRDSQAAAILVGKVFKAHPSSQEIQTAALANGFGIYLTARQKNVVRYALRTDYLNQAQNTFEIGVDCADSRNARPMPGYVIKRDLDNFDFIDNTIWFGPGYSTPSALSSSMRTTSSTAMIEQGLAEAARQYPEEFSPAFHLPVWEKEKQRVSDASLEDLGAELRKSVDDDTDQVRRTLLKGGTLIDILAIQYRMRGTESELKPEFVHSVEGMDKWQDAYDLVKARLHSVPVADRTRLYNRICDDAAEMVRQVKDLNAQEKDLAAKALGKQPASVDDSAPTPLFHVDDAPESHDAQ